MSRFVSVQGFAPNTEYSTVVVSTLSFTKHDWLNDASPSYEEVVSHWL